MSGMNWDRVNRENRAIRESNRVLEPEPDRKARKKHKNGNDQKGKKKSGGKRMSEKERALAWHRQRRHASKR